VVQQLMPAKQVELGVPLPIIDLFRK
jgi:hypothetical protein